MRWDITYMMETKGDIIQVSLTKLLKSTFGSMALQTTNQNTPKREYQWMSNIQFIFSKLYLSHVQPLCAISKSSSDLKHP